jgi:hypothetical protein
MMLTFAKDRMSANAAAAIELEDLRVLSRTIESRLCELGNLVTGQFPMTQREVIRGGRNIGIYFCVHGPRSVKLTAIYDVPKKQVILYGSDGLRKESLCVLSSLRAS